MINTLIIKGPIKEFVRVEREMSNGIQIVKSINFLDLCERVNAEYTKEVVPETFEELKELCKNLKSKSITIYNDTITIDFPSINGGNNFYIHITEKEIDINTSIFAQKRTIPQLWMFIKSIM